MPSPESESIKTHIALGIVLNSNKEVLIIRRAKQETNSKGESLIWAFPGGKIEPGEDQFEAARREVFEETGYEIEVGGEISSRIHPQFPVLIHYVSAYLRTDIGKELSSSEEVFSMKWVNPEELTDYFTTDFDDKVQEYLDII